MTVTSRLLRYYCPRIIYLSNVYLLCTFSLPIGCLLSTVCVLIVYLSTYHVPIIYSLSSYCVTYYLPIFYLQFTSCLPFVYPLSRYPNFTELKTVLFSTFDLLRWVTPRVNLVFAKWIWQIRQICLILLKWLVFIPSTSKWAENIVNVNLSHSRMK